MRILHLSDIHLARTDGSDPEGPDGTAALRRLLAELTHLRDLDAVIATGDIADDGSREAYARARELLDPYAHARGAEVYFTPGNHDDRAAFADVLGSGHPGPEAVYVGGEELAAVSTVAGRRLITLDSIVPGKAYGVLGRSQLDWLRALLATPSPSGGGTVLAFHHPPVTLDVDLQRALALQNPGELAEVIRGTDVELILCGHFHLQIHARLEQATVWVTPGVYSRMDLTARPGTERALHGPSATLIHLGGPHGPLIHTLHARDPRMGQLRYENNESQVRALITSLGPDLQPQ